jgi:hypothetical protein
MAARDSRETDAAAHAPPPAPEGGEIGPVVSGEQAKQGRKGTTAFVILAISLALAIIAFLVTGQETLPF